MHLPADPDRTHLTPQFRIMTPHHARLVGSLRKPVYRNIAMPTDYFGYSYASLTLLGGLIGLLKAGSIASLVASSVCAAAIAWGVQENQKLGMCCTTQL